MLVPHVYASQESHTRTSLVVQGLRLCLPMQGLRVWSLVRQPRSRIAENENVKQAVLEQIQ